MATPVSMGIEPRSTRLRVQTRSRGAILVIMPSADRSQTENVVRPTDIPTVPSNVPAPPPRAVMARAPGETNGARPKRVRRVPDKDMDLSLTIGIQVGDIEGTTFDLLAVFLEKRARMAIIATEGHAHLQLHIQDVKQHQVTMKFEDADDEKEKHQDQKEESEHRQRNDEPQHRVDHDEDEDNEFPVEDLDDFNVPGADLDTIQSDL
ncbi:hypothetical protein R1sor_001286 [Riccia sorocarpa]|uniref:Uncharacterized protein n=1 Tax=Riccia sorocarpa TaxID=122646 RepID=A0ABD3GY37_9MARC